MENKKTKLTISGNPKKSFRNFDTTKSQGKKTVVIEKKTNKSFTKSSFSKPFVSKQSTNFKKGFSSKPNFPPKTQTSTSDFERRKLAEQRATKRLKDEYDNKDRKIKPGTKKEN